MIEIEQTIEGIRSFIADNPAFLQNGQAAELPAEFLVRLQMLANSYAAGTRDLNERATACQGLMRRGMRQEALQLAKGPPDLRELARHIDFPEESPWLDLCDQYELAIPYVVDQQMIQAVVDSVYGVSRTREQLVALHRRMAMGRAPLPDRLRVLRALCKIDPDNDAWREDVETFEKVRVDELWSEVHEADKIGDLRAMENARREMASSDWIHPPDPTVLKNLDKRIRPHRKRLAEDQYDRLAEELRTAHSAMDEALCQSLLTRWDQVAQTTGIALDKSETEILPIREWLDSLEGERAEETAYEEACSRLRRSLDDGEPKETLERLAAGILAQERGMPELLELRYEARMAEFRRRGSRRFAMALIGVFLVVLAIGAAGTVAILSYREKSELAEWTKPIEQALVQEDWEGAANWFERVQDQHPEFLSKPKVIELRQELDGALAEEQERKDRFEHLISLVSAAGEEQPDRKSLREADALAKTPQEKEAVQEWRERIGRHEADVRAARQRTIANEFRELETLSKALQEKARAGDLKTIRELADQCLAKVSEIGRLPGLNESHKSRLNALQTQAIEASNSAAKKTLAMTDVERKIQGLKDSVTHDAAYAKRLEDFCAAYPEHEMTPHFAEAHRELELWRPIGAWQATIPEDWRAVTDTATASRLKARVEAYLEDYADGPRGAVAKMCKDYLTTAAKALDERMYLEGLMYDLNGKDFSSLWVLKLKNGTMRYLTKEPFLRPNTELWDVIYYTGPKSPAQEQTMFGKDMNGHVVYAAAQHEFAKTALAAAETLGRSGPDQYADWEYFYVDLIIAAANNNMDPILRAKLLSALLEKGGYTTPFISDEIKLIKRKVDDLRAYEDDWWDTVNPDVESKRRDCQQRLKSFRTAMLREELGLQLAKMRSSCAIHYEPIGMVLGDDSSDLHLADGEHAGELFILASDLREADPFQSIGTIDMGKPLLHISALVGVRPGSRVYLRRIEQPGRNTNDMTSEH